MTVSLFPLYVQDGKYKAGEERIGVFNSIFDTPTHRADSNVFYATMISSVSPVIDLRGIEKRFGYGDTQTIALDGVDLVIEPKWGR